MRKLARCKEWNVFMAFIVGMVRQLPAVPVVGMASTSLYLCALISIKIAGRGCLVEDASPRGWRNAWGQLDGNQCLQGKRKDPTGAQAHAGLCEMTMATTYSYFAAV